MKINQSPSIAVLILLSCVPFLSSGCMSEEQVQLRVQQAYEQGKKEGVSEVWIIAKEKGYGEGFQAGLKAGQKKGYDEGFEKGKLEGNQEGYQRGLEVGKEQGYAQGWNKGLEEGHAQGWAEGMKEGKEVAYSIEAKLATILQIAMWVGISLAAVAAITVSIFRRSKLPEFV